ncbi:MAG: NAD+ kinase [Deltaproteobacteria bacterium]
MSTAAGTITSATSSRAAQPFRDSGHAQQPERRARAAVLDKIVLVTRKTRLAELIERFNTRAQAKFYIDHSTGDFDEYVREDDAYRASLDVIRAAVDLGLKVQAIDRALLPTYTFTEHDVVVTAGQDGLVANTAKYAGEQPIVGVNPDRARIDGVLLPFAPGDTRRVLTAVLEARAASRSVTLAEARLNDGQTLLAFNDFFVGARSHISARYRIRYGGGVEAHSSSGVIVSTAAGSTGWLSSVFNMVAGVARFAGAEQPLHVPTMSDHDRRLLFVVREPFVSRHSQAGIVAGAVDDAHALSLESLMPSCGVIFSDGVESDALHFDSGSIATIGVAPRSARLVVQG